MSKNILLNKKLIKFLKVTVLIIVLVCFAAVGAGLGIVAGYVQDAPEVDFSNFDPSQTSFVLDKNNNLVTELHAEQNRVYLDLDDIPDDIINAFIAIEDASFYEHYGINLRNMIGALWTNIVHRDVVRGASTITQQLVKNVFLTPEISMRRKIQEMWLSVQLERKFTKDEIMEFYLNTIYFGHSAHGVQAAAQTYFGKNVDELTLAESAMIAGITNNPSLYSPYRSFERSKERQEIIINEMVRREMITHEKAEIAKNHELELVGLKNHEEKYKAPHFVDHVIREVVRDLREAYGYSNDEAFNKLYNGGLRIHTTLDMDLQTKVEEIFSNPENFPDGPVDELGLPQPQGAAVLLDYRTGEIRSLVGGRQHTHRLSLNRATQSFRQPGSAFKPISVYTAAIDMGITPATVYDESPFTYTTDLGEVWNPENYDRTFKGLTTVRNAVNLSSNIVAIKTLIDVGIDRAIEYAQSLGIKNFVLDGPYNDRHLPSIALGGLTKGVTPLEMTASYGTIANKGVYSEPIAYTKVTDVNGSVLLEKISDKRVAVSEQTAYIMTDLLRSVISNGTGWRIVGVPFDAAGKTGTTNAYRDVWFIGYTPHLVGSVWIGHDEPTRMRNVYSTNEPTLIWRQIMEHAHKNLPEKSFERPDNIISVNVCIDSGKLPSELCSQDPRGNRVRPELFVRGTEPTQHCDVHVKADICTDSNKLSTDDCPESSVETRVFIQRPEPYEPTSDGRVPADSEYEKPEDLCDIHGSSENLDDQDNNNDHHDNDHYHDFLNNDYD